MSQFERRRELGEGARAAIDLAKDDIIAVCKELFDNPEAPFEEHQAVEIITHLLNDYGFATETGVAEFPTAFQARAQRWNEEQMRKGLQHGHVAYIAEYHADPECGHQAGHHLIAGAAIAAGIGLAATLAGKNYGTVTILGTPGSGPNSGKTQMAAEGIFEPFDCAIGAQPAPTGLGFQPTIRSTGESLAEQYVNASYPEGPDSALSNLQDAIKDLVNGEDEQYTSVLTTDSGFQIRAQHAAQVESIVNRITALATTRAESSGSPVEITTTPLCRDMQVSRILARRMKTFGDSLRMRQDRVRKYEPTGVSDWGNLSHITSAVMGRFPISDPDSSSELKLDTAAFRDASNTAEAYEQMIMMAKLMALAGLDVLGDMEFRGFAEGELIRSIRERGLSREPRRWLGVHPVHPRTKPSEPTSLPDVIVRGPGLPPFRSDREDS